MVFNAADDAYDKFMGRYSSVLARPFADFADIERGQRVVDVGAGTGALATELIRRLGPESVSVAEPSPRFVDGLRRRFPDVDVQLAPAEDLPWADGEHDAALAQLVISFVDDPPKAVGELRRVVREGGVVAICMWDLAGGMEMLAAISRARRAIDESPGGDDLLAHWTPGALTALLEDAGLADIAYGALEVESDYSGYDEFWSALLGGVGPAGAWLQTLDDVGREAMRVATHRELGLPDGPFTLRARCNAVRGVV
jgi:SAM-dependent methyltransferase